MNNYEVTFIVKPDLDSQAKDSTIKTIKEIAEKHGGTIKDLSETGKKRLAYKIKKSRDGNCVLVQLEANPEKIVDMKKEYALNENILRTVVFRA